MKIKFLIVFAVSALFQQSAPGQNSPNCRSEYQDNREIIERSMKKTDDECFFNQLKKIEETERQVKSYDPMRKGYLVSSTHNQYLVLAVSPQARKEWIENHAADLSQNLRNQFHAALDRLAVVIAEKLPDYRIDLDNYKVRDAATEKLVKAALPDTDRLEIYEIGLKQAGWQTSLSEGKPVARFKNAAVRARRAGDDHPYCWLYYVKILEDLTDLTANPAQVQVTTQMLVACPR